MPIPSETTSDIEDTPDANYVRLTRLSWSGANTPKLEWKREGDKAVAKFGANDDATAFIAVLSDDWIGSADLTSSAIKKEETEHSRRYRGILAESHLRMKSMRGQIEIIPEGEPSSGGLFGRPAVVKIPLAILRAEGLQFILDTQERGGLAPQTDRLKAKVEPQVQG